MSSTMSKLAVPNKPDLHAALGRLAIAHTHLELMLRYVVKSVAEFTVKEALDTTSTDNMSDLRDRVKKLFKEKAPTVTEKSQLDALLGAAKRLSENRNNFLHSTWSETEAGETLLKSDNYQWGSAPTIEQVDSVTAEILEIVGKLNDARLKGFIYEVIKHYREQHG